MVKKIILSIIFAILISSIFFILFQYNFQKEMNINETNFFARDFDKSKILLIGSSHVGMLNAEKIEKRINQQYSDYEVFNLAKGSDTPTKRLEQLSQIISLKPNLIVYGIGYRDIGEIKYNDKNKFLELNNLFKISSSLKVDFLDNPKLTTLNVIRNTIEVKPSQNTSNTSTPFFPYNENHFNIMSQYEIEKEIKDDHGTIDIPTIDNNFKLKSLNTILNEFNNNNIKVILFVTPHNYQYLDTLSDINKNKFEKILNSIEEKNGIQINSLLTKYEDLEIWSSPNHITHNSQGMIYNEDISDMIIKKIKE